MWREGSWLLPYEQRQRWRRCRAVGGRRQRRHNFDWLDELYSAYALASLGAVIVHVNVQVVRADWTGVGYGLPGKEVAARCRLMLRKRRERRLSLRAPPEASGPPSRGSSAPRAMTWPSSLGAGIV